MPFRVASIPGSVNCPSSSARVWYSTADVLVTGSRVSSDSSMSTPRRRTAASGVVMTVPSPHAFCFSSCFRSFSSRSCSALRSAISSSISRLTRVSTSCASSVLSGCSIRTARRRTAASGVVMTVPSPHAFCFLRACDRVSTIVSRCTLPASSSFCTT